MAYLGAKCESFERAAVGEPQRRGDTPGWQVLVPGDMDFLKHFFGFLDELFWISPWFFWISRWNFSDFLVNPRVEEIPQDDRYMFLVNGFIDDIFWIFQWFFLDFSINYLGFLDEIFGFFCELKRGGGWQVASCCALHGLCWVVTPPRGLVWLKL